MRLVTFSLKENENARHLPRFGALLEDGERILDFQMALLASSSGSPPAIPSEPLGWFDLDGRVYAHLRHLHDQISRDPRQLSDFPKAVVERINTNLLAPVPRPGKLICIGLNYRDHAEESGMSIPTSPVVFSKFTTSVIGHEQSVRLPQSSEKVDYEAELAVVIGRRVKHVPIEQALDCVLGYTNLNDVSARDFQFADGQWQRGKSCDTFAPMGPYIATADEIPDPHNLSIKLRLNGQTLQNSNTNQLIFGVPELISFLSETTTLEPGDVIATGTPAGVGFARKPPVFLQDGDVVEVEIDGLGILSNPIRIEEDTLNDN